MIAVTLVIALFFNTIAQAYGAYGDSTLGVYSIFNNPDTPDIIRIAIQKELVYRSFPELYSRIKTSGKDGQDITLGFDNVLKGTNSKSCILPCWVDGKGYFAHIRFGNETIESTYVYDYESMARSLNDKAGENEFLSALKALKEKNENSAGCVAFSVFSKEVMNVVKFLETIESAGKDMSPSNKKTLSCDVMDFAIKGNIFMVIGNENVSREIVDHTSNKAIYIKKRKTTEEMEIAILKKAFEKAGIGEVINNNPQVQRMIEEGYRKWRNNGGDFYPEKFTEAIRTASNGEIDIREMRFVELSSWRDREYIFTPSKAIEKMSKDKRIAKDAREVVSRKLLRGIFIFENLLSREKNIPEIFKFLGRIWEIEFDKGYEIYGSVLEDEDWRIRIAGLKSLTELYKIKLRKDQEIDESPIRGMLEDEDQRIRIAGLRSLTELYKIKLRKDQEIDESPIRGMLEDEDQRIRIAGLRSLTELYKIKLRKDQEIDESPIRGILEDENGSVRIAGLKSFTELYKIKLRRDQEIDESPIRGMLEDEDQRIRIAGLRSLTELYKIKLRKDQEIDESFILEMVKNEKEDINGEVLKNLIELYEIKFERGQRIDEIPVRRM